MSISHKFREYNFGDGFMSKNSILTNTPYQPKILIIGTFNPNTPHANFADFFYGRNFFWPAFTNLFISNKIILTKKRMPTRGKPNETLNPTLKEIKELCCKLELTFCDLISQVLHYNNPSYKILQNDNIIYNEHEYNLIQDGKKNGILGLDNLDSLNQVEWSTKHIIEYLSRNSQIKHIYFTRKPTGVWKRQWNDIICSCRNSNRFFTNIFTPSAQGKPVNYSMDKLLNHWIHNSNPNFGKLNREWLNENEVSVNTF